MFPFPISLFIVEKNQVVSVSRAGSVTSLALFMQHVAVSRRRSGKLSAAVGAR
jgi:hypothetical protein